MNGLNSIAWTPQTGPQKALIDAPFPEIFYGGARGGGKTDGVLGKYLLKERRYGENFNAIFFRKELPMLDDAIERSRQIFEPIGGKYSDQKKTWILPNGGRLRFRPLERVQDADKYQGQNVTDCCVEEAGQYANPKAIDRLNGVLRSAAGVPTQLIMTGNPGGAGQNWIKKRYIDPCPKGMRPISRELPTGDTHEFIFIPSKLQNNKKLLENDPQYIKRLYLVGNDKLVRAWLEGDWNAVEGAYFDKWSDANVISPFPIPDHWLRFRSGDWGSAKPFSFGWWAVVGEWTETPDGWLPPGALVRYREWYGCKPNEPNTGLKLVAEDVGKGIAIREQKDPKITYGVLDPAAFAEDGGPSLAERIYNGSEKSVKFRKADNKRVPKAGAMGGWDQLRSRIEGEDFGEPYGIRPMIYCVESCRDSIRTIPVLQHDLDKPEDLDTDGEDHAADEWRYACMSRPWTKTIQPIEKGKTLNNMTLNDLWNTKPQRQRI